MSMDDLSFSKHATDINEDRSSLAAQAAMACLKGAKQDTSRDDERFKTLAAAEAAMRKTVDQGYQETWPEI